MALQVVSAVKEQVLWLMLTRPFDQLEFVERIPTWLVTNQKRNRKPLVDQMQTMLQSYLYALNWWSNGLYSWDFEMDIKNLAQTIILMLTAPLLTSWLCM
jgi:hypothetical protein